MRAPKPWQHSVIRRPSRCGKDAIFTHDDSCLIIFHDRPHYILTVGGHKGVLGDEGFTSLQSTGNCPD